MAKIGYPVVGIDTLRYYWQHKSPEQSALDLAELMQHYRQKWGTKRFILTGYSFGADVLPAIYNRLEPRSNNASTPLSCWPSPAPAASKSKSKAGSATPAKKPPPARKWPSCQPEKVVCIYGEEEVDESGCTDKTAVGEAMKLPGGHHFDENYPALAQRLVDVIEKRQAKETRRLRSDLSPPTKKPSQPHGCGGFFHSGTPQFHVERACSRKRCHSTLMSTGTTPSRASSLLQGIHSTQSPPTKKPPLPAWQRGLFDGAYISTCVPNSITRFNGRLKKRKLPLAFCNMNANNASRQRAMPSSLEAMTVSRLRK